jgi:hypothetical protein
VNKFRHHIKISKILFLSITLREKALMAACLLVILFVWANRVFSTYNEQSTMNAALNIQQAKHNFWIENKDDIENKLKDRLVIFDSKKTYTKDSLVGKVDALVRQSASQASLNTPITTVDEKLKMHTLRLTFRDVTLDTLIQFQQSIKKEAPYLSLSELKIVANKKNPTKLNADLKITSFELINRTRS